MKIGIYTLGRESAQTYEFLSIVSETLEADVHIVPSTRVKNSATGLLNKRTGKDAFFRYSLLLAKAKQEEALVLVENCDHPRFDALRILLADFKEWSRWEMVLFSAGSMKVGDPVENGFLSVDAFENPEIIYIGSGYHRRSCRDLTKFLLPREDEFHQLLPAPQLVALYPSLNVRPEPASRRQAKIIPDASDSPEIPAPVPVPLKLKCGKWLSPYTSVEEPPGSGKISFLFLTRAGLQNKNLWRDYLESDSKVSFALHCASSDSLEPWERARALPDSIPTAWGNVSLVRATLLMMRTMLEDPDNQHFVLCSESCIPIVPASEIRRRCWLSNRSFIGLESHAAVARRMPYHGERNDHCQYIPDDRTFFHPQWIILNRSLARFFVDNDLTQYFEKCFAPDETYFGTVAAASGMDLDREIIRLKTTWTLWPDQARAHPVTHERVPRLQIEHAAHSGYMLARKFRELSDSDERFIRQLTSL
jgi:hypothetical protein